jgi:hypothetical protein
MFSQINNLPIRVSVSLTTIEFVPRIDLRRQLNLTNKNETDAVVIIVEALLNNQCVLIQPSTRNLAGFMASALQHGIVEKIERQDGSIQYTIKKY